MISLKRDKLNPFRKTLHIAFILSILTTLSCLLHAIPPSMQARSRVKINFFIENSGSMNGYVNGSTEFKELISTLIVDLRNLYIEDSINIIFINEIQRNLRRGYNLTNFAASLSPGSSPYRVAGTDRPANTFFDEILNSVLSQTDSTTVSMLVSDCIYSTRDGRMGPEFVQPRVLDIFWGKLAGSKDFATVVYKLNSRFNGYYYSESRVGTNFYLNNSVRPYYLWIVGPVRAVEALINEIERDIRRISGYEARHVFSTEKFNQDIYWTILASTGTNAFITPDKRLAGPQFIRGISNIKNNRNLSHPLSLAIALDFSSLLIDEEYLHNPENYQVTGGSNWLINDVGKINYSKKAIEVNNDLVKIMPNDWLRLANSGATHVLFFSYPSKAVSPGNIEFSLQRKLPDWIEKSNASDDSSETMTFGRTLLLKPILLGVNDAYERVSKDPSLFSLKVSIKTTSGSNVGKTLLVLFLTVIVISVPALIIYNRKNS